MRYYLFGTFLLALAVLIIAARAQEQPNICQFINSNIGNPVVFDEQAYTFEDMPADLDPVDIFYVTAPQLPDNQVQAYDVYVSWEKREVWVVAYWSLEYGGNPPGTHDFCGVLRYKGR